MQDATSVTLFYLCIWGTGLIDPTGGISEILPMTLMYSRKPIISQSTLLQTGEFQTLVALDWLEFKTLSESWRDHKAHGLYADGSTSNGTTYGAWLVMNTKDT